MWERIKGRVIVGVDENQTEFNETGKTGGSKTHTLTVNEMPSHRHSLPAQISSSSTHHHNKAETISFGTEVEKLYDWGIGNYAGDDQPHNNLQPYQTAYVWKLISYSN